MIIHAINDLAAVLAANKFLDRVDNLRLSPGSRNIAATLSLGPQTSTSNFGKTKTIQELTLTVTIKLRLEPGQIAEVTKEIDKDIVRDRRRNTQAQTTILSEAGWTEAEQEGKGITELTRSLEIHYYEDQV